MKQFCIIILLISFFTNGNAQKTGIGTTTPNNSARLEVASSTQGFLPPRLTITQRDSIINPATGLTIYCTNCEELQVYSEGKWKNMNREAACTFGGQAAVIICSQVWMTKNLDVTTYRNGDIIPQVTDPTAWANLTTGAWCYYNNDPALGAIYGKLYNWYAVNDPRGLAPSGWHIPTNAEWQTLSNCLGGQLVAGGKMKEVGTIHWQSPNTDADNSSGFGGLPGGIRFTGFDFLGGYGGFWSSTSIDTNNARSRNLQSNNTILFEGHEYKKIGYSVRCVWD